MTPRPIPRGATADDGAEHAVIGLAVERLSARLFGVALVTVGIISSYTLVSSVLRPDAAGLPSYLAGIAMVVASVVAFRARGRLLPFVRRTPALVLVWTLAGLAVLWVDGSPSSTYFIVPASGIAIAAVLGFTRWAFAAGAVAVLGTVIGLLAWDLDTSTLTSAEATERIVTSAAIDLLIACVLALPIWVFRGLMVEVPAILERRRARLPPGRGRLLGGETRSLPGPTADNRRAEAQAKFRKLTAAERRVVLLLSEGLAPKVAAARLGVKTSTVRSHLKAAKAKTGARNLTGLCALAVEAEQVFPGHGDR